MLNVEKTNINLLSFFKKKYDKQTKGAAIEVGVGTDNFYFLEFKNLGFKTIAVEPLPNEEVLNLCNTHKIILEQACLYETDGKVNLYTGNYNDENNVNYSSLQKEWWGVNKDNAVVANSIKLNTLLAKHNIKHITYLKLDVEGAEYDIVKTIREVKQESHPKIVEFEYGGGGPKKDEKYGWAKQFYQQTLKIVDELIALGYLHLILVEHAENKIKYINLGQVNNIDEIFKDFYLYGNAVAFKEKKFYTFFTNRYLSKIN